MKLHKYQQEALDWHVQMKYSVNAFVMGLGKTVVALALHKQVSKKTLVVCPKYLIQNWRDEILKFGIKGDIEFCNFAMLKSLKPKSYDLVIVDEAHYLKNPSALRSTIFHTHLAVKPPKFLLLMTGTPCKNDVSELYNLINMCNLHHKDEELGSFTNIFKFKRRFMKERHMKFGKRRITDFYGLKNRTEYINLVQKFLLKKKLDEVKLPDAVHKILNVGDFSLDKKAEKLIDQFDKEAYMSFKTRSAKALSKYTADFAHSVDGQCVIFSDHVKSAEYIAKELEGGLIHGGIPSKRRDQLLKDFKRGEFKYLVATYKTAGVGLTLTNANYMIFNDLPFVPADIEQARARIRRIGQEKTCFYYYLGMSEMYFKLFKKLKYKSSIISDVI